MAGGEFKSGRVFPTMQSPSAAQRKQKETHRESQRISMWCHSGDPSRPESADNNNEHGGMFTMVQDPCFWWTLKQLSFNNLMRLEETPKVVCWVCPLKRPQKWAHAPSSVAPALNQLFVDSTLLTHNKRMYSKDLWTEKVHGLPCWKMAVSLDKSLSYSGFSFLTCGKRVDGTKPRGLDPGCALGSSGGVYNILMLIHRDLHAPTAQKCLPAEKRGPSSS